MSCYISTRNSRYYAATETEYGRVAPVTAAGRFSGQWLQVRQRWDEPKRRDKTGTRTHQGVAGRLRKQTAFEMSVYLYARERGEALPRCGALIEAAMGGAPRVSSSGLPVSHIQGTTAVFGAAHGLEPGDGLSIGNDVRIVTACPDAQTAWLSAPLTQAGAATTGGAVSYGLAMLPPSFSLYEYWTPEAAVQRILNGAVVDELEIELNGDFHEITFRGAAAGLIDSKTFEAGQGGLAAFPPEPGVEPIAEMPVPWPLETVASARIRIRNNMELRWRDFGLTEPKCAVPGDREVTVDLEIYSTSAESCEEIYACAVRREPMPFMVQMGEIPGAMCGIHIANLVPALPEFLEGEERLRWRLRGSVAQGSRDDEVQIVFA